MQTQYTKLYIILPSQSKNKQFLSETKQLESNLKNKMRYIKKTESLIPGLYNFELNSLEINK